ncbi:hypothetical protein SARC_09924, partial [Sphaeroforma arctica JP610]
KLSTLYMQGLWPCEDWAWCGAVCTAVTGVWTTCEVVSCESAESVTECMSEFVVERVRLEKPECVSSLEVWNCGFCVELWTVDCGLWSVDCGVWTLVEFGQASDVVTLSIYLF